MNPSFVVLQEVSVHRPKILFGLAFQHLSLFMVQFSFVFILAGIFIECKFFSDYITISKTEMVLSKSEGETHELKGSLNQGLSLNRDSTLSLPVTRICVNFSTVYNDTLVAKELSLTA